MKQPVEVHVYGDDIFGKPSCLYNYTECPKCSTGKLVCVRGAPGMMQPCDIGFRCTYCGVEADYYPPAFTHRNVSIDGAPTPPALRRQVREVNLREAHGQSLKDFFSYAMDRAVFEARQSDMMSHWLGIRCVIPRGDATLVVFTDGSIMYRRGDEVARVWEFKDERR